MKAVVFFSKIFIIAVISICLGNCSGQPGNKAYVTIDTGITNEKSKAVSTRAPSNITSLTLTVTAGGSTIFEQTYTASNLFDAITIELDPGTGRVFTLTAIGSGGLYTGSTTADISKGKNSVAIAMTLDSVPFSIASDPNTVTTDEPMAIALDDNYIYIAGYYNSGTMNYTDDRRWRIEKRDKRDGSLVTAFGSGGYVVSATTQAEAYDIVVDGNDLYIVGYSNNALYSVAEWRIEKRNATTGVLDTGFNGTGIITYNIDPANSYWDKAWAIAFDSTYLYIGGGQYNGISYLYQARIEKRLKSNGSLETENFSSPDGYYLFNSSSYGNSTVYSIAVDLNYIYTGGNYYVYDTSTNFDRIISRFDILSGSRDGSWITPADIIDLDDEFRSIALDSNSNIFLGGYATDASSVRQWQLEKYNMSTASLDTNFGSGGVVQSSFTANSRNRINSIAVDSEHVYSAGYEDVDGESITQWRLEKRDINTGALDTNFSTNGVFTINLADGDDAINDIAVDRYFIYIVGSDYSPTSGTQWRIIKMMKYNGAY